MSEELRAMRHSAEHVLSQAMLKLHPDIKMAMGPATEEGFYFDFDPATTHISEEDFPKIEAEIQNIINRNLPFRREELEISEARKLFPNNPYKQEWLDEIEARGEKAVVYWTGEEFVDLCAGSHVNSSGEIGPFKLLSVAGAYWRGDENNPMLTRIYGTALETQEELNNYLTLLEEAKTRDHRKIGKDLDLFSFHPEAPGDVFWHPRGLILINEMIKYWREVHQKEHYVEVRTPEILTREIWDRSGHTSFFLDKMYRVLTPNAKDWNMAVKPMNCDGGILIYKTRPRSYKEFPLRMGELGVVHRYEASGELHGILRPREFIQDDAHIYCTPDQVKAELKNVIDLCFVVYETFGLKVDHLELSTRPRNSIGSEEIWERAENIMKEVLKEKNTPHKINEGEGAFYGPKLDFHLKDSLGRTWQCATIQLDFAQPENFNLEYITQEGTRERPVMIHRVLYGSIERFLGIVIEDCAGAFPVWLSPVQVKVIPISEQQLKYAEKIKRKLEQENIRVELDAQNITLQAKIRNAQLQKIPYMLVVGEKEEKNKTVNVRLRTEEKLGEQSLEEIMRQINKLIKCRCLGLK